MHRIINLTPAPRIRANRVMKASELIRKLQANIEINGDKEVAVYLEDNCDKGDGFYFTPTRYDYDVCTNNDRDLIIIDLYR